MPSDKDFDAELFAERNSYLRKLSVDLADLGNLIVSLSTPEGAAERKRKLARDVHSIKGVAGSYGLDLISTAIHRMEDDLAVQELTNGATEKFVDLLLRHTDRLTQLVTAYLGNDSRALADIGLTYLPKRREPAAPPAVAAQPLRRVLLVETSQATLKMCVGVLNELGVREIATAEDGLEALGRLLKEPFQAVITSLHVPIIDGQFLIPVLRMLPGPNQLTPVILLTSSVQALDRLAARPDHIVEKNPHIIERLQQIFAGLSGATACADGRAGHQLHRVLKKIVLVDDSRAIHQLLRVSFKRYPEIAIAGIEDPTGALDFLRQEQPDLVLLDLNMPQLSGKELIRGIKAAPDLKEIPVAFFTAADSADERRELCDLGAWQVFKKPFTPKTFSADLIAMFQARLN